MSLAKGIVIVNEYTINHDGKGSRGSTPGEYVTQYMSRDDAVETLTPVKRTEQEDYIMRYMTRKDAVEQIVDPYDVKLAFDAIQKKGGIAFGYGSISLSDERLKEASRDIQTQFDKGKTVFKTVLSFDEDYLRENGIIPVGFKCTKDGDYRGNIDQMKLRMSIMHGLDRLSSDFDDLQYVGVIQVDTRHVHCHLAMVDRGVGRLVRDGTQRGKLTSAQKERLRRGIDLFLDETKSVQYMSSNVMMDKRNTAIFVKQVSHRTMQQNGMAQLLLAYLPDDKRLWRSSTNSRRMQKANTFVRDYVRELFSQPGSGYDRVQKSIHNYASVRRERESLSDDEFDKLIKTGEKRVEDECVNAVYGMLTNIEKRDRQTHTPMLDLMARSLQSVSKDESELGEFTYKLRSYGSRLSYHKREREKAHNIVTSYEKALEQNAVSADAKPVYDFFKFEEEYNEMLMCKYQHFLHFLPLSDKYADELQELLDYRRRVNDGDGMFHDKTIRRMTAKNAEEYAERVYHQRGGRYMTTVPEVIEARLEHMHHILEDKDKAFVYKITTDGLSIDMESDTPVLTPHIKYAFDDVKMLDIHHMDYDSPVDIKVSKHNATLFVEAARKRAELASDARDYLIASGQQSELDSINMHDIRLMNQIADSLVGSATEIQGISTQRVDTQQTERVQTIALSRRLEMDVRIQQSLFEMQIDDTYDTYGG